jgi:hypothetical protein
MIVRPRLRYREIFADSQIGAVNEHLGREVGLLLR